jgi:hypothetical protein
MKDIEAARLLSLEIQAELTPTDLVPVELKQSDPARSELSKPGPSQFEPVVEGHLLYHLQSSEKSRRLAEIYRAIDQAVAGQNPTAETPTAEKLINGPFVSGPGLNKMARARIAKRLQQLQVDTQSIEWNQSLAAEDSEGYRTQSGSSSAMTSSSDNQAEVRRRDDSPGRFTDNQDERKT